MAKRKKITPIPFSNDWIFDNVKTLTDEAFKVKTRDIFTKMVRGGLSRTELADELSNVTGEAFNRVGTIIDTGLAIVGRERIQDTAKDLGLTWYRYIGGTIKTSREFCVERDGDYFTQEEVESWADEEWDGMIEGTNSENIFSYCGGYNCRHDLIPVLTDSVPDEFKTKSK